MKTLLGMKHELAHLAEGCVRAGIKLNEAERAMRWALIDSALAACKGNQSLAAELLGVHRNTFARSVAEMRRAGRAVKANQLRGSAAPGIRRASGENKKPISAADIRGALVEHASLLRSSWSSGLGGRAS